MKRFIAILATILISLLSVSCTDKVSNPPVDDGVFAVNDTVWLEYGEKKILQPGNLEIGFDRVIEDSRCPRFYVCLQPGQGIIRLWIKRSGMDTIFFNVGLIGDNFLSNERLRIPADTLGHRFSVLGLYPYPVGPDPIPSEDYMAQIEIKEFVSLISKIDTVLLTDRPPDSIELDPFELITIFIRDDTLTLRINYSGGCEEHDFELYMSPSVFAESNPVQADLYLRHDANGDACRAYIQQDLIFDLRSVGRRYYELYGHLDPIQINVHLYKNEFGSDISKLYYPIDSL